ncbi:TIGR02285 family protein [Lacimicrobium sp. SS2-24]|uniref:TIGR02285 family protein n=1 Tax=Lacimicrobium sp. SS2-24 TaxID=2005569 RepID=UPI000B4B0E40|nr:TIGR02285 family protein [Lacimicrobium sp. SS2-24]
MKGLLVVLWFCCFAVCAEQILWLRPDFPPGTFVEGPLKDKGYNDLTRQFITERLPQFEHAVQTAGYERIVKLMATHNVCIVGLYKSEQREQFILYSEPRGVVLPNGLIIREVDRHKFTPYLSERGIVLSTLMKNSNLLGGVADGRLYKGPIDSELARYQQAEHVLKRSGANVFSDLLKMLDLKRIDYTFGFPVELKYQQRLGNISTDMRFIPVAGMPEATPSYIACSRNAWGENVIAHINTLLQTHRLSADYLATYQSWLDADSRRLHQKISEQRFAQHPSL